MAHRPGQHAEIAGDAEQREAGDQHPVTAPDLKAMSRPAASDSLAACAVRTLARTETFMPMKPAAPDRIAPMAKPIATSQRQQKAEADENDDADDADGEVLAAEIGLRALAHGRGNLLHSSRSRRKRPSPD